MTGLLPAIALFIALGALATRLGRDASSDLPLPGDAPRTLPNPGARDVHTVSGSTLGRAYVPSWG